jgi:hypothetical protein
VAKKVANERKITTRNVRRNVLAVEVCKFHYKDKISINFIRPLFASSKKGPLFPQEKAGSVMSEANYTIKIKKGRNHRVAKKAEKSLESLASWLEKKRATGEESSKSLLPDILFLCASWCGLRCSQL